jgi:hypothetical protein
MFFSSKVSTSKKLQNLHFLLSHFLHQTLKLYLGCRIIANGERDQNFAKQN